MKEKKKGKINSKEGEGKVMEPGEFAIKVNSVERFIDHLVQGRSVLVFFLVNLQYDKIMLNMQYEAACA